MAFRLIPREERFFDDFVALAVQIRKGAGLLEEMLAPERPFRRAASDGVTSRCMVPTLSRRCLFLALTDSL